MLDASVVICTHNPRRDHLHRVLDGLRNQTISMDRWELLIVDNASNTPLASTWDVSWHQNGRHIVEDELGLASARRRGMQEAAADLLVFVDDDNVLDPDYLHEAIKVKREWPLLGAWGSGTIVPECEVPYPEELKKWIPHRRDVKNAYWSNVPFCAEATPWGSGICVRAKVAAAYCRLLDRSAIRITGKQGKLVLGGEDDEICLVACKIGLGTAVFPQLRLTHLIPKDRVTEEYMVKLQEGFTAADLLLIYKWRGVDPGSPFSARELLSILKTVLIRRGADRRAIFARWRGAIKARHIIEAKGGIEMITCDERDLLD
jgi:glycosyltransferase involved in cell wall biosynthesis